MTAQDEANFHQVCALNQRGGRMLSIVDLIQAGTVSTALAVFLYQRLQQGCSFLTAAMPGGAGKTTLLGAMLGLIDTASVIIPVGNGYPVPGSDCQQPAYYVAHELGRGGYAGYMWGPAIPAVYRQLLARQYFAATVHADTPDQLTAALTGSDVGMKADELSQLGLVLFMKMVRDGGRCKRRVQAVYDFSPGVPKLLFIWHERQDRIQPVAGSAAADGRFEQTPLYAKLSRLEAEGITEWCAVREQIGRT